jgi:hypothetical protein
MPKQISESSVVCPRCKKSLIEDAESFEFCGVNAIETGFIFICVCGNQFVVRFEKSA